MISLIWAEYPNSWAIKFMELESMSQTGRKFNLWNWEFTWRTRMIPSPLISIHEYWKSRFLSPSFSNIRKSSNSLHYLTSEIQFENWYELLLSHSLQSEMYSIEYISWLLSLWEINTLTIIVMLTNPRDIETYSFFACHIHNTHFWCHHILLLTYWST